MATTPDVHHTGRSVPGMGHGQPPARQLDFYQAMSDFKHMFPGMEEEVIEAVLRANSGAVDATIDQLLTMSLDNELEINPPPSERNQSQNTRRNEHGSHSEPPPNYDSAVQNSKPSPRNKNDQSTARHSSLSNTLPPGYSPPSPRNAGVWLEPHADYAPRLQHLKREKQSNLSATLTESPKPDCESPHSTSLPSPKHKDSSKKCKHWNPPMLGTLPEDFLRITDSTSSKCAAKRRHRTRTSSSQRSLSSQMSQELLHQKLLENERKRCSLTADTPADEAQYLQDERTALMLQNQEFLQMLRRNEDFMRTLERDRMNAAAFDPEPASSPVPPVLSDTISPDQIEGYGQDRQNTLDTFPFGQELPKDEDAEFRKQLGQMGGSSKKKFQALARKFFKSKKKKTPKQMLKENSAPSTANLLEEFEDDEDDFDSRADRQRDDTLLGAAGSLPPVMYGQPTSSDMYNADRRKTDII